MGEGARREGGELGGRFRFARRASSRRGAIRPADPAEPGGGGGWARTRRVRCVGSDFGPREGQKRRPAAAAPPRPAGRTPTNGAYLPVAVGPSPPTGFLVPPTPWTSPFPGPLRCRTSPRPPIAWRCWRTSPCPATARRCWRTSPGLLNAPRRWTTSPCPRALHAAAGPHLIPRARRAPRGPHHGPSRPPSSLGTGPCFASSPAAAGGHRSPLAGARAVPRRLRAPLLSAGAEKWATWSPLRVQPSRKSGHLDVPNRHGCRKWGYVEAPSRPRVLKKGLGRPPPRPPVDKSGLRSCPPRDGRCREMSPTAPEELGAVSGGSTIPCEPTADESFRSPRPQPGACVPPALHALIPSSWLHRRHV